jgi:hypothetical protein
METIPKDILYHEFVMTLPFEDIINLCSVDKKFQQLCDDDELWIALINRDFSLDYHDVDVKQQYIYLNNTLDYFSCYFKIITYDVFMIIHYHLPRKYWHLLIEDVLNQREKGYPIAILNRSMFGAIMDTIMHDYINGQIITKFKFDLNMLYDELQLNKIDSQIKTCQDYIVTVTQPSLVFFYGKLTVIQHNLDIYDILENYIYCSDEGVEIYHYYLNL